MIDVGVKNEKGEEVLKIIDKINKASRVVIITHNRDFAKQLS